MSTSQRRRAKAFEPVALDHAEAVIVDQYTRLVRLAYLTLPGRLNRHRRVLAAHSLVQRALPGFRVRHATARVPLPRTGSADGGGGGPRGTEPARTGTAYMTARVLSAALAHERR
ncbi:hypothetical protein G3I28_17560, partial [Streptomyces sp. SID10116]|nr:hypothetical protein [Streptomyces sp. SID10116]